MSIDMGRRIVQCSAKSVNCSGILGTRIFQDRTCPISCALDVSENKWSSSSLQSAINMLVYITILGNQNQESKIFRRRTEKMQGNWRWRWTFEPIKTPPAAHTSNLFCSITFSLIDYFLVYTQYRNAKSNPVFNIYS